MIWRRELFNLDLETTLRKRHNLSDKATNLTTRIEGLYSGRIALLVQAAPQCDGTGLPDRFVSPFFRKLFSRDLEFGSHLVVKFEPDSPWYEISLALAADALRLRYKTEYHTFQHLASQVRSDLSRLGLSVDELEKEGILRIIDSLTLQISSAPSKNSSIRREAPLPPFVQTSKTLDFDKLAKMAEPDKQRLARGEISQGRSGGCIWTITLRYFCNTIPKRR